MAEVRVIERRYRPSLALEAYPQIIAFGDVRRRTLIATVRSAACRGLCTLAHATGAQRSDDFI
jgi:hypothetical protein